MKFTLLYSHTRPVTQVKFNIEGDLLFTCGKDKTAAVFRVSDGFRIRSFGGENMSKDKSHNGVVWSLDVTHDNQYLVTGSADMKVGFWDVKTGRLIETVDCDGPCKWVELNCKPGCQDRLAITRKKFMKYEEAAIIYKVNWDTFTLEKELMITDFPDEIIQTHWGAYDETIITTHTSGFFRVWDAKTGALLWEKEAHPKNELSNATFNHDRLLMLTTGNDGRGVLWNMATQEMVQEYSTGRPLNAAALHPHFESENTKGKLNCRKQHVLLGGGQKADQVTTTGGGGNFEILFYQMVHNQLLCAVKGHFSPINCLAWIPDGSGFVTGAEEGNCRIHKFDENDPYWEFD
eukprot:GDKJ01003603.1.p1 GENE.GDKJ01003603.1~~GDKJ01003603.1.p1  ORF type:complete len:347 (-),score=78.59 GDKJ01003603.1:95-1135(-)